MTRIKDGPRTKARPAKTLIIGLLVVMGLMIGGGLLASADHAGWHTQDRDDLDEHCPDHTTVPKDDGPSGGDVNPLEVDNVTIWLHYSEDLFAVAFFADENGTVPIVVEFCIKASDRAGGKEIGHEGNVTWPNPGNQRPEISYVVVYEIIEDENDVPVNDIDPEVLCIGPQWIAGFATAAPPTNHISWDSFEGATGYNLYRSHEGGPFELHATTDANTTHFDDMDVIPFDTYRYRATAQVGEEETDHCDEVEVMAIPVFPSLIAAAAAAAIGIGAYAVSRRRA